MSDHILLPFYVPHFFHQLHHLFLGVSQNPGWINRFNQFRVPAIRPRAWRRDVRWEGGKVGSKFPDTWNRINACSWSFLRIRLFSSLFTMIYHKSFKSPSVFWKVLVPELLFFGLWPRVTVHSANMLSERSFICKMKRHGDWYSQHGLLEHAHHADFRVKSRHTSSTACGLSLKHAIWKYNVPFIMSSCMNI